MEQRSSFFTRRGLHYTGLSIIVCAIIGFDFSMLSENHLTKIWGLIAGVAVVSGVVLAVLASPGKSGSVTESRERRRKALPFALLVVAAIGLPFGAWNLFYGYTSQRWPQTTGTISSVTIVRNSGKHGSTYKAKITYLYELAGTNYIATRVSFPEHFFDKRSMAQSVLARYPVGKPISVFYHSEDPRWAVLEPGLTGDTWSAPVLGVGALSASLILLHINRRRQG